MSGVVTADISPYILSDCSITTLYTPTSLSPLTLYSARKLPHTFSPMCDVTPMVPQSEEVTPTDPKNESIVEDEDWSLCLLPNLSCAQDISCTSQFRLKCLQGCLCVEINPSVNEKDSDSDVQYFLSPNVTSTWIRADASVNLSTPRGDTKFLL
eukprot:PhF_6_TR35083/c1_g1_i1/m.51132